MEKLQRIESKIKEKDYTSAVSLCDRKYIRSWLEKIFNLPPSPSPSFHSENLSGNLEEKTIPLIPLEPSSSLPSPSFHSGNIKIKLLCNWTSSELLSKTWEKMSKGNGTWNNISLVMDSNDDIPDYWVILNAPPPNVIFDRKKTIVFRMEPNMHLNPNLWKEWANPNEKDFLKVLKHEGWHMNNLEWHLSKTWEQLSTEPIEKNESLNTCISTVLSEKYKDIGQVKRVDFVKFLEKRFSTGGMKIDVFGNNRWEYKNYKGSLPYHTKDDAILPYKYTFNAENNSINNYITEKLIDGILGECLVFYWGCPNIREIIDPRAYVQLDLSNFEKDFSIVEKAIKENLWSQRLPYIREAKRKILNELQFFPRVEKILNEALVRL